MRKNQVGIGTLEEDKEGVLHKRNHDVVSKYPGVREFRRVIRE